MFPSISVIIPLYNKVDHIRATLLSVLSQKVLPVEIIVIDDGSTDEGAKIVENLSHPLIKLYRQANSGVSVARNKGVMLAQGEYVAFLDADDYWLDNHIQIVSELISMSPDAGMYSTMHEIKRNGKIIRPKFAYPVNYKGIVDDFFLRFSVGLSLINSSTACLKKQYVIEIGGFPEGIRRGEDLLVWIKMATNYTMVHASVVTAVYNKDGINRSEYRKIQEPPGSLVALANLLLDGDKTEYNKSIYRLFSQISFYTSAGMREIGDYDGISSILSIVKKLKLTNLYIKITLLYAVPPIFLTFLRNWRHGFSSLSQNIVKIHKN